jgi:hypothetical protein
LKRFIQQLIANRSPGGIKHWIQNPLVLSKAPNMVCEPYLVVLFFFISPDAFLKP